MDSDKDSEVKSSSYTLPAYPSTKAPIDVYVTKTPCADNTPTVSSNVSVSYTHLTLPTTPYV